MTTGRSSAAGIATASGLMPRILSIAPHGAIVGSAFVVASPIMSSARASRA